jgi:hypothetical protein
MAKGAMKLDVFRLAKFVVNNKQEDSGVGKLVSKGPASLGNWTSVSME